MNFKGIWWPDVEGLRRAESVELVVAMALCPIVNWLTVALVVWVVVHEFR